MKLGLTTTTRIIPSPLLPSPKAPCPVHAPASAVRRKGAAQTEAPSTSSGAGASSARHEHAANEAKQRILDAAAEELAARGLDGARVASIARAAGVAPTLVRRHFGGKTGLLSEVVARGVATLDEAVRRLLSERNALRRTRTRRRTELRAFAEAVVDLLHAFFARHPWLVPALSDGARSTRARGAGALAANAVSRGASPAFDALVAHLEQMQSGGELRKDIDPKHLVLSCVAMTAFSFHGTSLVTALWPAEPWTPEHVAERKRHIVDMILTSAGARSERPLKTSSDRRRRRS